MVEPLAPEGGRKKADSFAMSTRTQPSNSIQPVEGQHIECEYRAEWEPTSQSQEDLGVFSCSRAELALQVDR